MKSHRIFLPYVCIVLSLFQSSAHGFLTGPPVAPFGLLNRPQMVGMANWTYSTSFQHIDAQLNFLWRDRRVAAADVARLERTNGPGLQEARDRLNNIDNRIANLQAQRRALQQASSQHMHNQSGLCGSGGCGSISPAMAVMLGVAAGAAAGVAIGAAIGGGGNDKPSSTPAPSSGPYNLNSRDDAKLKLELARLEDARQSRADDRKFALTLIQEQSKERAREAEREEKREEQALKAAVELEKTRTAAAESTGNTNDKALALEADNLNKGLFDRRGPRSRTTQQDGPPSQFNGSIMSAAKRVSVFAEIGEEESKASRPRRPGEKIVKTKVKKKPRGVEQRLLKSVQLELPEIRRRPDDIESERSISGAAYVPSRVRISN